MIFRYFTRHYHVANGVSYYFASGRNIRNTEHPQTKRKLSFSLVLPPMKRNVNVDTSFHYFENNVTDDNRKLLIVLKICTEILNLVLT